MRIWLRTQIEMAGNMNKEKNLQELNILSDAQLRKLREYWIESAEQFVAAINTPEGKNGIKTLLEVDQDQLGEIIDQVMQVFPAEDADRMRKPVPEHKLGLLLDKNNDEKENK